MNRLRRGPVVLEGLAFNEKEARAIVAAFFKRKGLAWVRLMRFRARRAGLSMAVDVRTADSGFASHATSALSGDRRGKRRYRARSYPTT